MKFTDIPTSVFTLAPAMTEAALSQHVVDFTTHLKDASIIPRNPTDVMLRAYATNVTYDDYVNTFNNYWESRPEVTKTIERVLSGGIQGVSLLFGRKPPEKTFLRDIARAKVAERLVTT